MLGNVVRGVVGQIKWSYYAAAAINGYTVTRGKDDKRWYLTATVVDRDKFKMSQKPLVFVGHHMKPGPEKCPKCAGGGCETCHRSGKQFVPGQWFWPITDYELQEGTKLTATLGPPV